MRNRVIACTVGMMVLVGWAPTASATSVGAKAAPKASKGCDAGRKVDRGDGRAKISSGGEDRFYYRYIPRAYNGKKPLPVVFDLHGHTEPVAFHKNVSALGPFGDKKGFITVTPQGSGPPSKWETTPGAADLQFLIDLLDEIEAELCVDTRRVFFTGYSNGAFVASLFACDLADRIAAIAPIAGIRNPPSCDPSRPVPIVAFHGVADEWIAYEGGYGPGVYSLPEEQTAELIRSGEPTESGLSIPDVVGAWAERNDCEPAPTEKDLGNDVRLIRYECPDGADVQLYAIDGAGHTWPGSEVMVGIEQYIGPTTLSISATEIMWKFFQQHPLRPGA
jgi:polyhydroxybutyrate depolymerase